MARPRNIILLVADSLRYDSVHHGDSGLPYTTAHGARFTQARSGGCWTLPATASLFTGLLPHEHGADAQSRKMRTDVPTLAGRLKDAGWHTRQITANVATTEIFGLERGFDEIQRIWQIVPAEYRKIHEMLLLVGKPRLRRKLLSPEYISGQLAEDLEASKVWLQDTWATVFDHARDALREDARTNTPGFLFLNLMETHFPYHVGPTFDTLSRGPVDRVREVVGLFHVINQTWLVTGKQPIAPDMMSTLRERQRASWVRLAPMVDAFCREQHEQGNLVVFCSDHGDNFGEQGWLYHFSNVTDAGNRVPLYWLHPEGRDAGRRVDVPVSARDLYHSLLQEAGLDSDGPHLLRTPERSLPVMQSVWYDNNGKTLPRFRYNQLCFLEEGRRWLHRRNEWWQAPPATDGSEPAFERLPPDFDPFAERVFVRERRDDLQCVLQDFRAYSSRVEA